jgi:hypothetical protein
MKTWSRLEARDGGIASPELLNLDLGDAGGSFATLDRTQLPLNAFDKDVVPATALVQVWAPSTLGVRFPTVADMEGEQVNVRSDQVSPTQWECGTFQNYAGGWQSLPTVTLTGCKGGSLLVEWAGYAFSWNHFAQTFSATAPANPKHVNLRILVGGVTVAEHIGPAVLEPFRVFGHTFVPPGDVGVTLQWRLPGPGPDDPFEDVTVNAYHLAQVHLAGMKFLAICRSR